MHTQTNYLKVTKTARYVSYGQLSERTRYFWLAIHGSNMRCEQMIYKFKDFDPETHFIVAPEGLHRFYTQQFGGDVVAAWMTSRDRLHEINDLAGYLAALYRKYTAQLPAECVRTVVAFSQGGTIAFRWLHHLPVELDYLVAYSCWIPEDIDLTESKTDLSAINLIYTYGLEDQYLTAPRMQQLQQVIDQNQLDLHLEPYSGDHRVSKAQLVQLFQKYIV